jgi:hypothetical protein
MSKFENYIFLTICEKSYELFKTTKYMTYVAYCNIFKVCFKLGKLSYVESSHISEIINFIKKIYDLEIDDALKYTKDFFMLDKHLIFEESSRLTMKYYNNCYN